MTLDIVNLISHLRSLAAEADHVLSPAAYLQVKRLLEWCAADSAHLNALRALSAEYGRREFLLNVDAHKAPLPTAPDEIADFRRESDRHPGFKDWFQEGQVDGRSVLLVARWLCHLAGLRHRTVQLFLDHPTAAGYTLLQVRGFDKAESPGCFDLPCAGHVTGLETIEQALFHELEEELGLDRSDVSTPEPLGSYLYHGDEHAPALYNVEYCTVYRSRPRPGALSRIRFVDREVAAVALFATSEVGRLIEAAPERVASGLAMSWSMYLKR